MSTIKELWEQKIPSFHEVNEEEETEYDKFVKKMLDKEGKSLGDMTDKETKEFWKKVDKKWNADDEEGKDGKVNEEEKDKGQKRISKCVEMKMENEDWGEDRAVAACIQMEEDGNLNNKGEYTGDEEQHKS